MIPPSPYLTVNAYSSFPGIQIKVQRVGYIYYFWCDATLTSDVNLSAANTSTYFLRSQDFMMEGIYPFEYFAETVPLHFHLVWNTATSTTATPTEGYFNLRVDNTGIYVRKTSSTALYARSNRTITFHFAIPMLVPIVP